MVCELDGCLLSYLVFFFKQKTAYEVRISDWSSDVCSSDRICGGGGAGFRTRSSRGLSDAGGRRLRSTAGPRTGGAGGADRGRDQASCPARLVAFRGQCA